MRAYYVYMMTSQNNQVLYIGVTNDLMRRVHEHKAYLIEGFTKRYNVTKLVYFEQTPDIYSAISREKQLKKWRRDKKNKLIETLNSDWRDLYDPLFQA